jgi:hypothetical protein
VPHRRRERRELGARGAHLGRVRAAQIVRRRVLDAGAPAGVAERPAELVVAIREELAAAAARKPQRVLEQLALPRHHDRHVARAARSLRAAQPHHRQRDVKSSAASFVARSSAPVATMKAARAASS